MASEFISGLVLATVGLRHNHLEHRCLDLFSITGEFSVGIPHFLQKDMQKLRTGRDAKERVTKQ